MRAEPPLVKVRCPAKSQTERPDSRYAQVYVKLLRQNDARHVMPIQNIAVVFRDGEELFLFWRIIRNHKGELFVIFPRDYLNSHTSYHADGTHHHKLGKFKFMVRRCARPAEIHETVNLMTTSVAASDPRAFNKPCRVDQFTDVLEIPTADLISSPNVRTPLAVDIAPINGQSTLSSQATARIIRQKIFQDAVPWIIVTLFYFEESIAHE